MMAVHRISNALRTSDDWGSGCFAASRGGRFHLGRDYRFIVGERVRCPVEGKVLRIGHPYSDDLSFKLIEILGSEGKVIWRFFYVSPAVAVGETIVADQVIGTAQDVSSRYKDKHKHPMDNHVHVECILDPEAFFDEANRVDAGRGQLWV